MAEPKTISVDDALEEGVYGTLYDTIDNEAYTVSGQGEETAKREREQLHELRHEQRLASGDEGDASSSKRSKSSKSSKSSESSGGSAS